MILSIVFCDLFSFVLLLVSKLQGCCHVCEDILFISLLSFIANSDDLDKNLSEYGVLAWLHFLLDPCEFWGA